MSFYKNFIENWEIKKKLRRNGEKKFSKVLQKI